MWGWTGGVAARAGALGFVAFLAALGCAGPGAGVPVSEWTFGEAPVSLPARLDVSGLTEGQPFTLTTEVELPSHLEGQPVDLCLAFLEGTAELSVNGSPLPLVDPTHPGSYRRTSPHRWRIPASMTGAPLRLELSIDYVWPKSAWLTTTPRLMPAGVTHGPSERAKLFNTYVGWGAVVALTEIGLGCLLVFFLDRQRKPYLYFAIQALTATSYPLFVTGLSQLVLGLYDIVFVELFLVIALTSSVFFTHAYYRLAPPPRWLLALLGASAAVTCVLLDPFLATHYAARTVVAVVSLTVVYQLVTLARLFAERPRHRVSISLLAGAWIALASTTWCDLVSWLAIAEPLDGMRLANVGLTLFAMFLTLLLSRSHILSLAAAGALNLELSEKVTVIERQRAETASLADDLRAKVSDRASQLLSALSLLQTRGNRAMKLVKGDLINDRYTVVRSLGHGAMGQVYEVTRNKDESRWAMKLANQVRGAALARLAREAYVAAKLKHENIVAIRDIDVSTQGLMYMVMELVDGVPLRKIVERSEELSTRAIMHQVAQMARGLAALHAVGIAHRDLKPDNVIVTGEGETQTLKIVDFGISRFKSPTGDKSDDVFSGERNLSSGSGSGSGERPVEDGEDLDWGETGIIGASDGPDETVNLRAARFTVTVAGSVPGTPHYMAPELAEGADPSDVRSDLWSLGVIAFELTTGSRPYAIPPILQLAQGQEMGPRDPLDLPESAEVLRILIEGCLSVDPGDRPTAEQVASVLGSALAATSSERPPEEQRA